MIRQYIYYGVDHIVPDDAECVIIHPSVEHICEGAFFSHQNIREITFHPDMKSIGDSAFELSTLQKIENMPFNIQLGDKCFDCDYLHSVSLSEESVTLFQSSLQLSHGILSRLPPMSDFEEFSDEQLQVGGFESGLTNHIISWIRSHKIKLFVSILFNISLSSTQHPQSHHAPAPAAAAAAVIDVIVTNTAGVSQL